MLSYSPISLKYIDFCIENGQFESPANSLKQFVFWDIE